MGNRAVIVPIKTKRGYKNKVAIYLHWNGGRDSIEGFLTYCRLRGFRSPENDSYGLARLAQVIANYFHGGLSIGVDLAKRLDCDNRDNGVYLVKNWQIIKRDYFTGREQNEYKLLDMVKDINSAQPKEEQIENIEEKLNELKSNS